MANKTLSLSSALYTYLVEHSVREPEILQRLRAETAKDSMSMMQIGPEQGQLMQLLVRLMGAKNCLEVGVFTGYSRFFRFRIYRCGQDQLSRLLRAGAHFVADWRPDRRGQHPMGRSSN